MEFSDSFDAEYGEFLGINVSYSLKRVFSSIHEPGRMFSYLRDSMNMFSKWNLYGEKIDLNAQLITKNISYEDLCLLRWPDENIQFVTYHSGISRRVFHTTKEFADYLKRVSDEVMMADCKQIYDAAKIFNTFGEPLPYELSSDSTMTFDPREVAVGKNNWTGSTITMVCLPDVSKGPDMLFHRDSKAHGPVWRRYFAIDGVMVTSNLNSQLPEFDEQHEKKRLDRIKEWPAIRDGYEQRRDQWIVESDKKNEEAYFQMLDAQQSEQKRS